MALQAIRAKVLVRSPRAAVSLRAPTARVLVRLEEQDRALVLVRSVRAQAALDFQHAQAALQQVLLGARTGTDSSRIIPGLNSVLVGDDVVAMGDALVEVS